VRLPYGNFSVTVDPMGDPLMERLELIVTIDHNCVATAKAQSLLMQDSVTMEISDLEFGLKLPRADELGDRDGGEQSDVGGSGKVTKSRGSVRLRSNVTNGPYNRHLIPGELLGECATRRQHDEKMYYVPCMQCGRNAYHIERFGCDQCAMKGFALSNYQAEARWAERMKQYREKREVS